MEAFLPTEIARLVYGYLKEEECDQAAQIFLETSKHLVECLMVARKGRRFHTRVLGRNLVDILDLLSEVTCLVRAEVKNNSNVTPEHEFLNNLIRILGIDETETKVSNTTNTVYLSISVPTQEENVKKKPSTSKNVEQAYEGNKSPKKTNILPNKVQPENPTRGEDAFFDLTEENVSKNPSTSKSVEQTNDVNKSPKKVGISPNKVQPENPTEEEDVLFDLNMLNTLLDNTALHERLAENINKAISTGENVKQKGEDKKIIETILNNTEADPIFDEIVNDLAGPRAEDSTTPDDTEVEGGETCDENRTDKTSQGQVMSSNEQKEQRVEEQNDEVIRSMIKSILATRSASTAPPVSDCGTSVGQGTISADTGTTKSLVELAMEKAGVSEDRSVMDAVSGGYDSPEQERSGIGVQNANCEQGTMGQQLVPFCQQQGMLNTPPPMVIPPPPAPAVTTAQPLGTQYSLLQVLPSNFSTLYIQSVPPQPLPRPLLTPTPQQPIQQPQFAHSPQFSHSPIQFVAGSSSPRHPNIFTIDHPPPIVAPTLRPVRIKPAPQPEPPTAVLNGTENVTSINESVVLEKPTEESSTESSTVVIQPVIKRSGVRTRGGISKLRGRQKERTLRAIVPKIKNINEDQIDIELVECTQTVNNSKAPNITKRCLRPRNNKDKLEERSVSPSTTSAATESSESSVIEPKTNSGALMSAETTIDTITTVQQTEINKPQEESTNSESKNPDSNEAEGENSEDKETKMSDIEKDDTPEQRIATGQNKKRLSLSTPRRGSHVRVLDFRTPSKKNLNPRKANTSPKTVSQKRLLQFQKSIRKVRRNTLLSCSTTKEGRSKPWDADLRALVRTDVPTSVGLKRKVSDTNKEQEDAQKVTEECNIKEKTESTDATKNGENSAKTVSGQAKDLDICENINNTPDVSKESAENTLIEELATSDEIVKHIEKEVLDVIGEEGLNNSSNISLSPYKFKQPDKTSDVPPVVVVNEKTGGEVQDPESDPTCHSEKEVSKVKEPPRNVDALPKSLPNFLQTPAKIDFTGALPKTPVALMTPVTKIINEQVTILDGKKLLTPGFPPTPQGREAPEPPEKEVLSAEKKITSVTTTKQISAKPVTRKSVDPENTTPDITAKSELDKVSKKPTMDKLPLIEVAPVKVVSRGLAKRTKISPESKKLNSVENSGQKQKTSKKTAAIPQKNNSVTRSSLTQKKGVARENESLVGKKVSGKKSLKKDEFENEAFIKQCLQSAKESLFGELDSDDSSSSSSSSSSEPGPSPELLRNKKGKVTNRKNEIQPRIVDKFKPGEKNNLKNKKTVEPADNEIKPPSFDVAMARFKNMSYFSDSSSSDDSIFENSHPHVQSSRLQKRKLKTSEEDASRDSFPRLYLSDDETNMENTTRIKNSVAGRDFGNAKDSAKLNKINENEPNTRTTNVKEAPVKETENDPPKHCKIAQDSRQTTLPPNKQANNVKTDSPKLVNQNELSICPTTNKDKNDYRFLTNYTESYTVISNETGLAVNRVFKISPVISLYEHGLTRSPKRTVSRLQKTESCNIQNGTPEQIKTAVLRHVDSDKTIKYSGRIENQEESSRKIAALNSEKEMNHKSKFGNKRPDRGNTTRDRWHEHYRHRPRYKSHRMSRHSPDRYLRVGYDRSDDRERMIRDRGRGGIDRSLERERSDERERGHERIGGQKQWGRSSSRESCCELDRSYADKEKCVRERSPEKERTVRERSLERERVVDKMKSRKEFSNERERGYRERSPDKERSAEKVHKEERSTDKDRCSTDRGRGTRDRGRYGGRDGAKEERRRTYHLSEEPRRTRLRGTPKSSLSARPKFRKEEEIHFEESKTLERCKPERNNERYANTENRSEDNCKVVGAVAVVVSSSRDEASIQEAVLEASPTLSRASNKQEKRSAPSGCDKLTRGTKRKFIEEKEEGELSDSSSVQVNVDNMKKEPKEKRLCELENSHLEQQRNTLLKQLDLDHFLSIVHGSKD